MRHGVIDYTFRMRVAVCVGNWLCVERTIAEGLDEAERMEAVLACCSRHVRRGAKHLQTYCAFICSVYGTIEVAGALVYKVSRSVGGARFGTRKAGECMQSEPGQGYKRKGVLSDIESGLTNHMSNR